MRGREALPRLPVRLGSGLEVQQANEWRQTSYTAFFGRSMAHVACRMSGNEST